MNDKQKRPAPTIDLTATEVTKASADEKAPSAAEPEQQMDESTAEPNTTLPPEEQHEENTPPPSRSGSIGASLAAGFAGAVFATAVLAALWFAGLLPIQLQTPTEQSVQIANMQKQIEQLQARPAPAGDKVALDTLRQRLSKLESDIAVLPSGDKAVAGRLVESDKTIKSLGAQIAELNKRSEDIAAKANQAGASAAIASKAVSDLRTSVQSATQQTSAADSTALNALKERVGALEQALRELREKAAKASDDTDVRRALSAAVLRDAVESGAPYQAELAQAKLLGGSDEALAPLERFADSGVPTKAVLARQLGALLPKLTSATRSKETTGSIIGRLQANASRLVRIQPVDMPPGNNPADTLARIDAAAAHADINAALAGIGKLPETARGQAAEWVTLAVARRKALAAAHDYAAKAARDLSRK
jgi:hypothetical protein